MPVLLELIHRIHPATPNRFADFVTRYGECAMPAMERCGWDVLGAWKWSTRELFTNLVLVRFDSMADYETAAARFEAERAKGTLAPLAEFSVREQVRLARTLPYATDERLETALASSSDKPRQFIYARLKTHANHLPAVAAEMENMVGLARSTSQLATAYTFLTDEPGELVNFWASEAGPMDMPWKEAAPRYPAAYEEFYEVIEYETVDYVNPLPYSRLR